MLKLDALNIRALYTYIDIRKDYHMKKEIGELRGALMDITGVLNRPQPDAALIAAAGIDLDRALFPLLVRIERLGPIGIVELAELVGRDHSTVSRQIAKLDSLGLVSRCPSPQDGRVKAAIITEQGRVMTDALDSARQKIIEKMLSDWKKEDVRELARLLRHFADDALAWVGTL
ncbi:transcriptional regulator [Undibacterium sp. YM2]|nr:transcriptional regulator [Undibacterium sp. YM2]